MAFRMERWYSATGQRCSIRKYDGEPDEQTLQALQAQAQALSTRGVRIVLGSDPKAFSSLFLGSGRIKGTTCFAAFLSKDGMSHNAGYLGEAFVLECTAMGLSTCWVGMYNKKAVAAAVGLQEGETLTCIAAIGVSEEPYAARPRKPLEKLVGLTEEEIKALPSWQQYALICARIAPSATNGQPWRFLVEEENIRICCTGNNYGYANLDCGIAMLHMELGAAHGGVAGDWVMEENDAVFKPVFEQAASMDDAPAYLEEEAADC